MCNWLRRGFCLLTAFALLTGVVCATGYDLEKVREPVDFADMVFTPFDETALTEALDSLESLCGPDCQEDDLDEARRLYETILTEYERLDTLYSLADIHYYITGAASEWAEASDTLTEQGHRLQDRIYAVLRQLAKSPCREVLVEEVGEDVTDSLTYYEDMSDEMSRLLQEENQLVQQYDQAVSAGVEVTVDGQVWTDESLDAATDLDVLDALEISNRLDEALNEAVGETFRQLVQVRTAIAEEEGYDDYIDYAYASYHRDYSPSNVKTLRQAVKSFFVPLNAYIYDNHDEDALNEAFLSMNLEGETLMQAIQPGIAAIHPDLETSFDFLMQHQLYDTDPRPEKLPGGFTISLPSYGSAYIYNSPYGTYQDFSDMVHEFGHFNQAFYDPTPALWQTSNMDTAEIHSQGLQLLYASSSNLFGDLNDDFFFSILSELVDAVQEGCMYDEFLAAVYKDPDLSLDEINRLFKEISEDYGYYYPDGFDESYFWVRVPHNFQSPFYYISYAVSALSSLDLWLRSLEDWDGAVQTYLDLTALSFDTCFRAALKETGLANIFERAVVREIADSVESVFLGESVQYQPPAGPSLYTILMGICYLIGIVLGLAALLLPVVLIIFAAVFIRRARKRRKTAFQENQKF